MGIGVGGVLRMQWLFLGKVLCFWLFLFPLNSVAYRKAKIVYNFGLCKCNRVK